jgi:glycerol-3-phosphate dehydrogenase (NAD(P)+)
VKNVIALAVGIAGGMGMGDNTKASLITRGLAETTRLGLAMGADPYTFAGLAGMGDLVATCSSPQSRNRTVGFRLGQGQTLEEIVADLKMVAEGVKSSQACVELGRLHGVEMPIVEQVAAVVHDGVTAAAALDNLLARATGFELAGIPH